MYKAILGSKPGKGGYGKKEVVFISCLLLAPNYSQVTWSQPPLLPFKDKRVGWKLVSFPFGALLRLERKITDMVSNSYSSLGSALLSYVTWALTF